MNGPGAPAGRADLRAALREAARQLAAAGVASAEHDARALAAHVLGLDRFEPALAPEPPAEFFPAFAELVRRRAAREPLQHIVGHAPFRYLELTVRPGVFVPRPETELVAQEAIDEARRVLAAGRAPLVVDLCCGTGAIALAVATEVPDAVVVAVDASATAVELTRDNAVACGLAPSGPAVPPAGRRLRVECADATAPSTLADLDGRVDVVVSNPPYIPPDAVPVDPEVRDHDPAQALYGGGPDGLAVPQGVLARAADLLRDGGLLVMEHADVQGAAVRELVARAGAFDDARTLPDLTGRDRMVVARRVPRRGGHGGMTDSDPVMDCTDPATWGPAIDEAVHVLARGGLVVLPTDTVYGIGADAFAPAAVAALLAAKGRGRQMPPPVLVPDVRTVDGLCTDVPEAARRLMTAFWPGALTVICRAQPSLAWDLGETRGTVAVRMPDHPAALALLRRTGPLAVSSANRTGSPAAVTAGQAREQLGDAVAVYLDAGPAPGGVASTIVDATTDTLRVVRVGALSVADLAEVAPVEPPQDGAR